MFQYTFNELNDSFEPSPTVGHIPRIKRQDIVDDSFAYFDPTQSTVNDSLTGQTKTDYL